MSLADEEKEVIRREYETRLRTVLEQVKCFFQEVQRDAADFGGVQKWEELLGKCMRGEQEGTIRRLQEQVITLNLTAAEINAKNSRFKKKVFMQKSKIGRIVHENHLLAKNYHDLLVGNRKNADLHQRNINEITETLRKHSEKRESEMKASIESLIERNASELRETVAEQTEKLRQTEENYTCKIEREYITLEKHNETVGELEASFIEEKKKLQTLLDESTTAILKSRENLVHYQRLYEDTRKDKEELAELNNETYNQFIAAETHLEDLKLETADARQSLVIQTQQCQDMMEELTTRESLTRFDQGEIYNMKNLIEQLKQENTRDKDQKKDLETEISSRNREITHLQRELASLETALEHSEESMKIALDEERNQLARERKKYSEISNSLREAKLEIYLKAKALEELTAKYSQLDSSVTKLRENILTATKQRSVRPELRHLRSQLRSLRKYIISETQDFTFILSKLSSHCTEIIRIQVNSTVQSKILRLENCVKHEDFICSDDPITRPLSDLMQSIVKENRKLKNQSGEMLTQLKAKGKDFEKIQRGFLRLPDAPATGDLYKQELLGQVEDNLVKIKKNSKYSLNELNKRLGHIEYMLDRKPRKKPKSESTEGFLTSRERLVIPEYPELTERRTRFRSTVEYIP